jgi:hypothetical protein
LDSFVPERAKEKTENQYNIVKKLLEKILLAKLLQFLDPWIIWQIAKEIFMNDFSLHHLLPMLFLFSFYSC